jgi:hypothetical protein
VRFHFILYVNDQRASATFWAAALGREPSLDVPGMYVIVSDAAEYHRRAIAHGARELSPLADRSWGHRAAYSLAPDNHVLAFAEVPSR